MFFQESTETKTTQPLRQQPTKLLRLGALAGLAGGLVFGIIMVISNMLPTVGMLVGQDSAIIGFVVHIMISAAIGIGFGAIMGRNTAERPVATIVIGIAYGFFWWILGGLTLMPLLLGMPGNVLVVGQMQIDSLIGHLLYGLTVGVVINWLPA